MNVFAFMKDYMPKLKSESEVKADHAVRLLRHLRLLLNDLEEGQEAPDHLLDAMRHDLRDNLLVQDDTLDATIHDTVWLMGAAGSSQELMDVLYKLIAKVQIFALYQTGIDASRLTDYSPRRTREEKESHQTHPPGPPK
jgi:hypothetical protein